MIMIVRQARCPVLLFCVALALLLLVAYDICYIAGVHSLVLLGKVLEMIGELEISPGPHILFWKAKKVGGTTICGVLQCHAEHEDLRFMGRDEWLDTSYAKGGLEHLVTYNKIVENDILCFHKADTTAWPLWMAEGGHDFHQVIMFRDPLQQAVAGYYQKHIGAGVPSSQVAEDWLNHYLDDGLWLKFWGFVSSVEDAERVLDQLMSGHNLALVNSPMMKASVTNVTILLFDHFVASLCLLSHELGINPDCLELPARNVKPHPLSSQWPKQVVDSFTIRATDMGLYKLFHKAQIVFGLQYNAAAQLYIDDGLASDSGTMNTEMNDKPEKCLDLGMHLGNKGYLVQSAVPKHHSYAPALATCFKQLELCDA